MSAALLPCPVCGAPAGVVNELVEGKVWSVQCSSNRLDHSVGAMSWSGPDDLAARWNQRVADTPSKSLNALAADLLRPYLKPGQKVIWRQPFRWFDDDGVLSNHYDGMSIEQLAEDFGYDVDWDFNMHHAAIVSKKLGAPK